MLTGAYPRDTRTHSTAFQFYHLELFLFHKKRKDMLDLLLKNSSLADFIFVLVILDFRDNFYTKILNNLILIFGANTNKYLVVLS